MLAGPSTAQSWALACRLWCLPSLTSVSCTHSTASNCGVLAWPSNICLQDHGRLKDKGPGVPPVARVELVQKTNLWGFQGGLSRPYLKIVCALPNLVAPTRGKRMARGLRGAKMRRLLLLAEWLRTHAVR